MAKKRHSRNKRQRRRNMKGGAFSQEELTQLQNNGFSEYQIESLQDLNVTFNEVMQKVNTIMNQGADGFHGNSDDMTEQVMIELLNEHVFENQANQDAALDTSGYTTDEDASGGKRRKSRRNKNNKSNKKKTRRHKQRGGRCYGNGVGANNSDPNYSIYNTNMLKLFPYKS